MKKRKNLKRILIFLALALIGFAVWFFFFLDKENQEGVRSGIADLFPFGEVRPGNPTNTNPNIQVTEEGETSVQTTTTEEDFVGPRFRQITQFPTAGFIPITRNEQKQVTETTADEEGTTVQKERTILLQEQAVRYTRIEDGGIFETILTPAELKQDLVVKNFVPNAEHSDFTKDGNNVVYQYWNHDDDTTETYVASIQLPKLDIEPCPYFFEKEVTLGENSNDVLILHKFLNQTPQTRISTKGLNSPGNESSIAQEATFTAIKNFQGLNGIKIDGVLGEATREKMLAVCNDRQRELARQKQAKTRIKYETTGYFLPQGVREISVDPNKNSFFYLQEDSSGVVGYIRDFAGDKKTRRFSSPFTEWTPHWGNESLVLYTNPSFFADGFAYKLDPEDGSLNKLFKERTGLTTRASKDDLKYLVSESTANSIKTGIFNTGNDRVTYLRIKTLPEKCAWANDNIHVYCGVPQTLSKQAQYPDNWYLGLETFTDSLWKINTETLKETLISNISSEYRKKIDTTEMRIDEKGEYLYFINKNDETLWSYRLFDV